MLETGGEPSDVYVSSPACVMDTARRRPEVGMAASTFRSGVPQIYLNIDRKKAEKSAHSVPASSVRKP